MSSKVLLIVTCLFCMIQVQAETIKVAVSVSLAPYVLAESNGGVELQIIREALALKGHDIQLRYPKLKQVPTLYQEGQVDAAMTINDAFVLEGYFSDDYIKYQNYAITLKRKKLKIDTINDLKNKSIVAFENAKIYLGSDFMYAVEKAEYREVANQIYQVHLLYSQRTEVVIADKNIFMYMKNKAKNINTKAFLSFHPIFKPSPYKMIFKKESLRNDFNQGLTQLKASGRYQQILAQLPPAR